MFCGAPSGSSHPGAASRFTLPVGAFSTYPSCQLSRTPCPARPARALFLPPPACLPNLRHMLAPAPLPSPACPSWRSREGPKLRLSECLRIKDRKDKPRKLTRQPPRLTHSQVFRSFLPRLFVTWNRRAKPNCETLRATTTKIITKTSYLSNLFARHPVIHHVWLPLPPPVL